MRLHEAKKIDDNAVHGNLVQESVCAGLCMVLQAHVWHLQTKSYPAHKALGDFYEFLQEKSDELAESYMGTGGELSFKQHSDTVNFQSKEDMVARITNFRNKLNDNQAEIMSNENATLHGCGDLILDIVKESDKLLYLLTLE